MSIPKLHSSCQNHKAFYFSLNGTFIHGQILGSHVKTFSYEFFWTIKKFNRTMHKMFGVIYCWLIFLFFAWNIEGRIFLLNVLQDMAWLSCWYLSSRLRIIFCIYYKFFINIVGSLSFSVIKWIVAINELTYEPWISSVVLYVKIEEILFKALYRVWLWLNW